MSIYFYVAVVFGLAYLWIRRRFNYWKDRGFEQADASFPLGSIGGVGTTTTTAECLNSIYKKFKGKTPVVGFYNFLSPQILPIDTEMVKNILVKEFPSFHDRSLYFNKEDDPMSANILTLKGDEWRERRVKFSPIFTSGKMKMMFDIIDSIGDKFVQAVENALEKSDTLEMRRWSQRFTNDNIGNVAFGIDTNCLEDDKSVLFKMALRTFELTPSELIKFIIASSYPRLGKLLKVPFLPKEVADFFLNVFRQTFQNRLKNPVNRNDFVQMLLNLKDTYTETELASEAFLVYSGGFETSSTLVQFTLYELALHPEMQDRLRKEIKDGIEENGGKLTYDMLFGFKYLNMVILETLRKYPPIPNIFRKCTKEYQIPGTDLVIPKDTSIIINSFSLHRDPQIFPDPLKFDPERFSDDKIANINQYAHIPFGNGPRNCLGERFGLMQSKIGVVKLLTNFAFAPCDKTPIPIKFAPAAPFLAPVGGMWLNVRRI